MIEPDKREDSLYYGNQTRWRAEHPLLADNLSQKDLDRLQGFTFRYALESRGFSSNQAMALLFLRWDINRRFGKGLNKREIIENDKDWKFPKEDKAKHGGAKPAATEVLSTQQPTAQLEVDTHDKPYEPLSPGKYLSAAEIARLIVYRLRYNLVSLGFSEEQAGRLLYFKWRRLQGKR